MSWRSYARRLVSLFSPSRCFSCRSLTGSPGGCGRVRTSILLAEAQPVVFFFCTRHHFARHATSSWSLVWPRLSINLPRICRWTSFDDLCIGSISLEVALTPDGFGDGTTNCCECYASLPVFFYLPVLVKPFLMLTTPLHRDRRRLCSVGDPGSLHVDSSASAHSPCRLPHREHLA